MTEQPGWQARTAPTAGPPAPEPLAPGALGGGLTAQLAVVLPAPNEELDKALALAYRRLGRRDHTEMQLRELLARAGVESAIVVQALATLVAQGYVDDLRFARRFTEDRRKLDGWGAQRIRAALHKAGVAEETIASQLERGGVQQELAAALSLLSSRMPEPPRDERSRARALGLLLRRGYDTDLAYEAVRRFERLS